MAGADTFQGWNFMLAAIDGKGTARLEGAAVTQLGHVGGMTNDRLQPRAPRLVQAGDGIQQAAGIGMPGPVIDIRRYPAFNDASGVHHIDPVGIARHDAQIMGNNDQGNAHAAGQFLHQFQYLGLNGHIQGGRRFVGDDQLWAAGEGHGNHHPLAHAA